ncbi:MAG: YceI family protein [Saprospiraceae bacterium]|nr:YceI family protein [Lewinella sp.]
MANEAAVATKWAIDPAHSEVQFKVKHLVITTVTGSFESFSGSVSTESENFDNAKIDFAVDVSSINTRSTDRDNHLRSNDFFAVEEYPEMTFSGVLQNKGGDYKLVGDLTIRGTTNKVTLEVDYNGTVKDPWGNTKAGFEVTGKLNRKDFGLTWNTITEAGSMLVGEEVKLEISIQLTPA